MGLYDRDYSQEHGHWSHRGGPQMPSIFRRLTPVVGKLLIINVAVYLLMALIRPLRDFGFEWLSVYPVTFFRALQVWRLVTYQFMHDPTGFGHIFFNMLALYFFGPMLENYWGSRRFIVFYLICGALGGVVYPLLVLTGFLNALPMVGASGAIFGILAAGAMLFPNLRVYVWGIFPIRLVVLAIVIAVISFLGLIRGANAGGEAAHLAGMAGGVLYVMSASLRSKLFMGLHAKRREKYFKNQHELQVEVDRILQKVHDSGIGSLTHKEKKTLKRATEAEQMRNRI